ncbi:MAG: hypothetical protein HZA15_12030 [Nitrospirae bacterium]|nr:hypothetical protein [Nitrospirota bacterium]
MISRDKIPLFFSEHRTALESVRHRAEEAREMIEAVSPIIECLTSRVCPDCTSVCCINRHSDFDYSDNIFMSALNKEIPEEDPGVAATDPCRFLGRRGCLRERPERPYRCTWFFCSPLLEVIGEQMPLSDHRNFIEMLRKITELRTEMIRNFETVFLKPVPAMKNK